MNKPRSNTFLYPCTVVWLVVVSLLWGCKKDEQPEPQLQAEFPTTAIMSSSANPKQLRITAAGDWTLSVTLDAEDPAYWCSSAMTSGSGDGIVWLTVKANPADDARKAQITVASGTQSITLELTQKGIKSAVDPNRVELPAIVNPDNVFYHEEADYTLEYYPEKKHSRWVAWPLNTNYFITGGSRTDAWALDPDIPSQYQPVRSDFYGYDRGHLCPSADRTKNDAMNRQTFYYSNMTPQVGVGFNQGIWANLENLLRGLVRGNSDVLYICAGGTVLKESDILKYQGGMAVPKYNFKVVVRRKAGTGAWDGIGFWFENRSYGDNSTPVSVNQVKTIRQIEGLTGIDFFHNLDATTQNKVETDFNPASWGVN